MSEEQLRGLEVALEISLKHIAAFVKVKVQRIRWVEDVDDEGEVTHIPILDEFGMGEDAVVVVTWPAIDERGKVKTTQIINLELLENVGAEELAEMLAPNLKTGYATLLRSDKNNNCS